MSSRSVALFVALGLCAGGLDGFAAPPRRVAVLYFDNDTKDPDLDLLRKGMADMLITDLSELDGLTVVEREKLDALLSELKLQRSKYFDPKTASKLGRGAGASHVVTGAFNAMGPELRIDVRLVSVETGEVVTTAKVRGKKAEFFDLQQRIAAKFACRLVRTRCEAEPPKKGPDIVTVRRFAQGLDLADAGDLKGASKALQEVVGAAPSFGAAKASYRRVMKQLYAARGRRSDQRARIRAQLEGHAEAAIARPATPGQAVGYRVLLGQLALQNLDSRLRALAAGSGLDSTGLAEFESLVRAYLSKQARLLKHIEGLGSDRLPDCEISEEDAELGEKLGLGDEPGVLSFYSAIQIHRDLGLFLSTGAAPFWGTFRFSKDIPLYTRHRVDSGVRGGGVIEYREVPRPPVERLHGKFAPDAIRHFEVALAAAERLEDADARRTETIRCLDAFALGLRALKRPMEAIARWQAILDRFPDYEEYGRIEGLVRSTLEE